MKKDSNGVENQSEKEIHANLWVKHDFFIINFKILLK